MKELIKRLDAEIDAVSLAFVNFLMDGTVENVVELRKSIEFAFKSTTDPDERQFLGALFAPTYEYAYPLTKEISDAVDEKLVVLNAAEAVLEESMQANGPCDAHTLFAMIMAVYFAQDALAYIEQFAPPDIVDAFKNRYGELLNEQQN